MSDRGYRRSGYACPHKASNIFGYSPVSRGENDGEVGFGRVTGAMEDRPSREVALGHPKRLLHVPEVVVAADHLRCRHHTSGDVGDVALETDKFTGPAARRRGRGWRVGRWWSRSGPSSPACGRR